MPYFRKLLFGLSTLVVFAVVLSTNPVSADEFSLGIIIDPSYTQQSRQEFINGFQLAVDQSPDISHPEGEEGGDHLGGIDVDIISPNISKSAEELVSEANETASNADIIIADLQSENLNLVYELITSSKTYLLSTSSNQDVGVQNSTYYYGLNSLHDTQSLLSNMTLLFSEEYARKYETMPTADAERGYISGRLIDLAVGATNSDPADTATMTSELDKILGATNDQIKTPIVQKAEAHQQDQKDLKIVTDSKSRYIWFFAIGIVTSTAVLVAFWRHLRLIKK